VGATRRARALPRGPPVGVQQDIDVGEQTQLCGVTLGRCGGGPQGVCLRPQSIDVGGGKEHHVADRRRQLARRITVDESGDDRLAHIGIVAMASTTLTEPFLLSTQIATLDYVSHGRAGWQVDVLTDPGAAGYVGPRAGLRIRGPSITPRPPGAS
jgi:hypothetical protein